MDITELDKLRAINRELIRQLNTCPACNGKKTVLVYGSQYDPYDYDEELCEKCHGSGQK